MNKKAVWFSNFDVSQKSPVFIFVVLWVLISLSCILPGTPEPKSTEIGPASTASPIPTIEPTLQSNYPATLLEVWPADGSVLERQPEFTFYFNQPMNNTSVEKNIAFQPDLTGTFNWIDEATLKFKPQLPLPALQDLKIELGSMATSQSGQAMQSAVTLNYHFPGALKISERIPNPETKNVDPSAPLLVSFNQPIVPFVTGEKTDDAPAFTLTPQASGKGAWLNTSTYVFYPSPALSGNTTYQLTLRSDLAGAQEGTDWKFNTAHIAVA
jgi:alpha-2-macroglobulin